jgi:hypothetical protein
VDAGDRLFGRHAGEELVGQSAETLDCYC